jgi:hypothetical protein
MLLMERFLSGWVAFVRRRVCLSKVRPVEFAFYFGKPEADERNDRLPFP